MPGMGPYTRKKEAKPRVIPRQQGPDPSAVSDADIARFRRNILAYYAINGRDLPWRHTNDPYHILVSEIMLQQTRVDRVVKKYPQFLEAFPTCQDLANARLSAVLDAWQGMGYNRRAVALRECARVIVAEYDGRVPEAIEDLERLSGIGAATARSIAAFAFNQPVVFIETNIRRVFIHFFFQEFDSIRDSDILPLVERSLDRSSPSTWYSALMDYGAMLKTIINNPNRRSAHYTRQSKFEGSDRQIRGTLLRAITRNGSMTERDLGRECGGDERVHRIIRALEQEGYIRRQGDFLIVSE